MSNTLKISARQRYWMQYSNIPTRQEIDKHWNAHAYWIGRMSNAQLKKHLICLRMKEDKCEDCGIDKWNDKPITIQLDHVDGNKENRNYDNLRFRCPNCHSQTSTFAGRNKKFNTVCRGEEIILTEEGQYLKTTKEAENIFVYDYHISEKDREILKKAIKEEDGFYIGVATGPELEKARQTFLAELESKKQSDKTSFVGKDIEITMN